MYFYIKKKLNKKYIAFYGSEKSFSKGFMAIIIKK